MTPLRESAMAAVETVDPRELAASRLAVYSLLRAALDKPTPAQHAWLRGPEFRRGLELVCEQFDLPSPEGEAAPEEYADFESRYIACFEVGLPAPPVALQASAYDRREPAPAVIHEHILFFKRFGLRLPPDGAETADHLLHELAFLLRLDELLIAEKMDVGSLLLARRDFLNRRMTRWIRRAADDAAANGLPAIYQTLLSLLARAVNQDLELTGAAVVPIAKEKP
jgi:DMSO reductase family type II enzyme chaperone